MHERFSFKGKKSWWFDLTKDGILFRRPYRQDGVEFLLPEERNIKTFQQALDVWGWHYYHGLAHRRPHPLGINLYDLHCAYVDALHEAGQMWAKKEPLDVWMSESSRMCQRDGLNLMPDGSMAERKVQSCLK